MYNMIYYMYINEIFQIIIPEGVPKSMKDVQMYNGHMYNQCIKVLCSLYLDHVKIYINHT